MEKDWSFFIFLCNKVQCRGTTYMNDFHREEGHMNELEKMYKEIQPKIYAFFFVRTLKRDIAEDLTHDVFYEAIKSMHSFSGSSSIQTWLFSIARNLLKKYYRSKKYKKSLHDQLIVDKPVQPFSPEDVYILQEENIALLQQIERLDQAQKEIVTLRLYGELSFKEIGELTNKSENYVRVTFHRAKLKIQKELRMNDE